MAQAAEPDAGDPCRLYLVTPTTAGPGFADTLARALDAGDVAAVQLRLKEADDDAWRRAIDALRPVAQSRGVAFLLSALANLAALRSSFNILAFSMANVVFSLCAGVFLLTLGAYGRVSGNLPPDSPYAHPDADTGEAPESYPSTPEEFAAEAAMREAEIAVSEHRATDDQRRRVRAMAVVHTRAERRRVWMDFDPPPTPQPSPSAVTGRWADRAAALARARRQREGRPSGK